MEYHSDLPGYCSTLLFQVLERTGYRFVVTEVETLGFDSELQMAGNGRPYHSLDYLSAYRDHKDHFLVNAAKKVLRVWDTPLEQRYVPASSTKQRLPREEEQILFHKMPLARDALAGISRFVFSGLVRQLTSFPTDLRVERELSQELLEHKDKQLAYLRTQVRDFLPTLDERMARVFPEKVYRASTGMNIAFAEEAAAIAGVSPDPLVTNHSSRKCGEALLDHLHSVTNPGLAGDIRLTDAWAKELGLEGWFEWKLYEVD
jgi:hypothetical protein